MAESHKIVIAPHVPIYVGDLGITQFGEDLSRIMLFTSSWDRHWRRKGTVTNLDKGDIMIFAFKNENDKEWYVIGDAVLLYEGVKEGVSSCEHDAGDEWKCCYHFTDFRLYSKYISYEQMKEELSNFRPDIQKVVHLSPDDYVHLLSMTATQ